MNAGVNFAASNINLYNGSKISTNIGNNFNNGTAAMGKVKIVTGDGVTFKYYNSGAIDNVKAQTSKDKMVIQVNGEITAGNIDIRNYSTHGESQTNLLSSKLKAVKAVQGNDGNIWLTATNNVIVGNANISTEKAEGASGNGANVYFQSGKKTYIKRCNF